MSKLDDLFRSAKKYADAITEFHRADVCAETKDEFMEAWDNCAEARDEYKAAREKHKRG